MTKFARGWIPNEHDPRDARYMLDVSGTLGAAARVEQLDIEWILPAVLDQGGDRSCVLQVASELFWAAHVRLGFGPPFELISRKGLGYWARDEVPGMAAHNVGTQMRTPLRVAKERGFCRERHWPHDKPLIEQPDEHACQMMFDQRQGGGSRLRYEWIAETHDERQLDAIRAACIGRLPVGLGLDIGDAFDTIGDRIGGTEVLGGDGHALVCCGFRRDPDLFKLRSSWGLRWAHNGSGWFKREVLLNARNLVTVPLIPNFSDKP